jgi:hypothetical protein
MFDRQQQAMVVWKKQRLWAAQFISIMDDSKAKRMQQFLPGARKASPLNKNQRACV